MGAPLQAISGNAVTLLRDGRETFPALLEAIASARRYVHLEVFRIRDDRIGRLFRETLLERAKAGVPLRMLYDVAGCFATPESFFAPLRAAGAMVLGFHPFAPWKRGWSFYRRNHRKLLVVDGTQAFVGGVNLDACHAPAERGGGGWRDLHVALSGPATAAVDDCFWESWEAQAPRELCRGRPVPQARHAGDEAVEVIANGVRTVRSPIRKAYLEGVTRALKRVWITNPYFLPDGRLVHALGEAAGRGVDVRVMVPQRSDVRLVDLAARPLFRHLVAKGVRVFRWPRGVLHSKAGVIDGSWSTVGSFNLDAASFVNLEINLVVHGPRMAKSLEDRFEDELSEARELLPAEAVSWPRHLRMAEWTLHGLTRGWL